MTLPGTPVPVVSDDLRAQAEAWIAQATDESQDYAVRVNAAFQLVNFMKEAITKDPTLLR